MSTRRSHVAHRIAAAVDATAATRALREASSYNEALAVIDYVLAEAIANAAPDDVDDFTRASKRARDDAAFRARLVSAIVAAS